MMDLDAIKKRREDFNNAMREQAAAVMRCPEYDDNCGSCSACEKAELAATEFWNNIEDDEAALIEEVKRLRGELAKFHECEPDAHCLAPARFTAIHPHGQPKVYHKEGE